MFLIGVMVVKDLKEEDKLRDDISNINELINSDNPDDKLINKKLKTYVTTGDNLSLEKAVKRYYLDSYDLVKKYNQDELSSTIFFKLLYRVRRIEFNNAVVSDIDLYDLISTVVSRELSIKRLEYDKDTSPIEKLLGLFMVEDDVKEIISKNIKSLEREITPNGVGIERDTTNIKLIKTLKKINEIK